MKKRSFFVFAAFCALLFLQSCLVTHSTPLVVGKTYPAIKPEDVIIYVDANDIPQPFEKVAIINVHREMIVGSKRYWNALRKKCAEMGCNGIYKISSQRNSSAVLIGYDYPTPFSTYVDENEFVGVRFAKN